MSTPTFKSYNPEQLFLLPPSVEELIKSIHPVRVFHKVIEGINIDSLLAEYPGGGTSSYHPKMMLKVIVFAYLSNIYSSRKIEAALEENIHFMWLSGMSKPDHNSINRFRSDRLQNPLKEIFVQIVQLLAGEGLLDIKALYTDGTKIEANANRYTFVWGKAAERSRERIKRQVNELWSYAQKVAKAELNDTAPLEFNAADAGQVEKAIAQIDDALSKKRSIRRFVRSLTMQRRTGRRMCVNISSRKSSSSKARKSVVATPRPILVQHSCA
jgi:transposase